MGVQLLKITAFSSPRILIINPKAPVSRFLGHIDSSGKSTFHLLCKTQYHESPLTPKSLTSSATGFPACFYRSRRSFRGGVVAMAATGSVQKSEEEWQAILSPEQFRILRQKGTEFPGTGEYDKFFGEGIYNCAGCGTPLYRSTTKFDSGCGWPAFFEGLPGAINRTVSFALLFYWLTQMGGELKLHVQLVVGTLVMYLKARVSLHQLTNVIVLTASQSSLFQHHQNEDYCDGFS
ncbi:peptide methionine sulfoxide reductase B2, chloroplastic-like isoform X1 [Telopea speciosissima]|uniref:peptide methionine sulfoxide reductase B2, chloroplastic-like isoform X1 n=1 Tax=Telopea speciosissima TaxID=54955 RepID=UPI001CC74F28|nr:peptide methionine sulfoxide reductase B2, chloroplastic-like isoform X1 [Telopea speciosissima]